jgi:two-component system, chemotaxis family, response regulator Rcp1
MLARDIEILVVEPDATDARRATAILKRTKVRNHVTVVADAAQALAHLRREANHYKSPKPSLILLSADQLAQHGEDLLKTIKSDAKLAHIPVVFIRTSCTEAEVRRAYDLDANCYVHKPLNDEQMDRVLDTTKEFWLTIAKLPMD